MALSLGTAAVRLPFVLGFVLPYAILSTSGYFDLWGLALPLLAKLNVSSIILYSALSKLVIYSVRMMGYATRLGNLVPVLLVADLAPIIVAVDLVVIFGDQVVKALVLEAFMSWLSVSALLLPLVVLITHVTGITRTIIGAAHASALSMLAYGTMTMVEFVNRSFSLPSETATGLQLLSLKLVVALRELGRQHSSRLLLGRPQGVEATEGINPGLIAAAGALLCVTSLVYFYYREYAYGSKVIRSHSGGMGPIRGPGLLRIGAGVLQAVLLPGMVIALLSVSAGYDAWVRSITFSLIMILILLLVRATGRRFDGKGA